MSGNVTDEVIAEAALDNRTEQAVADAIESLHGVRTLIVIVHRLSTVRSCDRLRSVAIGSPLET